MNAGADAGPELDAGAPAVVVLDASSVGFGPNVNAFCAAPPPNADGVVVPNVAGLVNAEGATAPPPDPAKLKVVGNVGLFCPLSPAADGDGPKVCLSSLRGGAKDNAEPGALDSEDPRAPVKDDEAAGEDAAGLPKEKLNFGAVSDAGAGVVVG